MSTRAMHGMRHLTLDGWLSRGFVALWRVLVFCLAVTALGVFLVT